MRAQGLPLTTIVAAVLAIVLVFFIFAFVFNIGGISEIFNDLFSGSQQGMNAASFRNRCEMLCVSANGFDPCSLVKPQFCTETADTSADGGNIFDTCYKYDNTEQSDVYKHCVVTDSCGNSRVLSDGATPDGVCSGSFPVPDTECCS